MLSEPLSPNLTNNCIVFLCCFSRNKTTDIILFTLVSSELQYYYFQQFISSSCLLMPRFFFQQGKLVHGLMCLVCVCCQILLSKYSVNYKIVLHRPAVCCFDFVSYKVEISNSGFSTLSSCDNCSQLIFHFLCTYNF